MTGPTNLSQGQDSVPFQFCRAQPPDFDVVATLFEALHSYNSDLDDCFVLSDEWRSLLYARFMESYTDPDVLWLLAWQDVHPAGLLILKTHTDSPLFHYRNWTELVAIYVVPPFRGQQLAEHLMTYAQRWTAAHGLNRLQLYVTATNEHARRFYSRCGLRPVQEIWRLDLAPPSDANQVADHLEKLDDVLEPGHPYFCDEKRRG